jgi:hypothetical protein
LIRLKQQEIDLRAMDLQRKAQEAQMKEQGQFTRQEAELALDIERLKSQEEAQANRLDVAKAKKGSAVFYASENKGTIKGVTKKTKTKKK